MKILHSPAQKYAPRPELRYSETLADGLLYANTLNTTVKSYLSFQSLRLSPDYHQTEDNVIGVEWRSTPDSIEGNLQGIRVPTLIVSGTCAPHIVYTEIAYNLSAATDKELVGVEGANHGLMPASPSTATPPSAPTITWTVG